MPRQIYGIPLLWILGALMGCGSIPTSGQGDVQNILAADIVIRIRTVDEVRDFGMRNGSLSPSLIGTYPGGYKENKAPTFESQLTRRSFDWYERSRKDPLEANKLLRAVGPKVQIERLAFSENNGQVALSLKAGGEFVATEIVVLDRKTLSSAGRKRLPNSRYVADFLWERGSQSLLLVEYTERYSFSPLGILAAIAGHPMPFMDFYSARLDLRTMELFENERPFLSNANNGSAVLFVSEKK